MSRATHGTTAQLVGPRRPPNTPFERSRARGPKGSSGTETGSPWACGLLDGPSTTEPTTLGFAKETSMRTKTNVRAAQTLYNWFFGVATNSHPNAK